MNTRNSSLHTVPCPFVCIYVASCYATITYLYEYIKYVCITNSVSVCSRILIIIAISVGFVVRNGRNSLWQCLLIQFDPREIFGISD